MRFQTRPYRTEDYDWLYELREESYRTIVERQFGEWDETLQKRLYAESWQPELVQVIESNGKRVGMLCVNEKPDTIHVIEVQILPSLQNQGLGSELMIGLIEQARETNKSIWLQVLHENHRARQLYLRLGFSITGKNDTHHVMSIG